MSFSTMSPRLIACAVAVFSLGGCYVGPGSNSAPFTGTISVFSSIEGSTQSYECGSIGATDLELAVYEGNSPYTTATAPCFDFQIFVELPEGDYNADATLIDRYSRAVSTTLRLDDLRVLSGTELRVDIDFPWSSILP